MAVKKLARTPRESIVRPKKAKLAHKTVISSQAKSNVKMQGQQQRYLKQNFTNSRIRQELPTYQRVWRKTIVLTKPKPKIRLPRLFRTDQLTGLPVDYELTVSKIMHHVNPYLSKSPYPEHLMEKLLTRTLAGFLESCSIRCPQSDLGHQIRPFLKSLDSKSNKKNGRNDNEELSQFHSACKRGPVMPDQLAPTYKSKFNYNSLRIHSK